MTFENTLFQNLFLAVSIFFGFVVSLAPHIGGIFANHAMPPNECEMVNTMSKWLFVTSVIYICLIGSISSSYLIERCWNHESQRGKFSSYGFCLSFVIFTVFSLFCGAVIIEMTLRVCIIWKELLLATVFVLAIPSIQSFLICIIVLDCRCGGRSGYIALDD